jgi:hypothetical protein
MTNPFDQAERSNGGEQTPPNPLEDNLSFLVKEITVKGSFKAWGEYGNNGRSGGTDVSYTVVPHDPTKVGWTPKEAGVVSLGVRLEVHKIIMADAQIRKVPLTSDTFQSLNEYTQKLEALKQTIKGDFSWREKALPPPENLNESNAS